MLMSNIRFVIRLLSCSAVCAVPPVVQSQTVWLNAVDGAWTNTAMWSAGSPAFNSVGLTAEGVSYEVTVDSPPSAPFTDLTVSNRLADSKVRLTVAANALMSTNGVITVGRCAEVVIRPDGVMRYVGGTSKYPFIDVRNGGVWRVEGGSVELTDLPPPPVSGRSQILIGNGSTGSLYIASGSFHMAGQQNAAGTNSTLYVGIGSGTGGRGYLTMTGGVMTVCCYQTSGNVAFGVGMGSRALGAVSLTNDASLSVSNWVQIGSTSGTGCVVVAGTARLQIVGRLRLGCATNGLGSVTVSENGSLDCSSGDSGVYLGGYDDNNRGGNGQLNVLGGCVRTGSGVTLCRSRSSSSGYAEANLSGGVWILGEKYGYGLTVSQGDTALAGGRARASLNVAGGLLDISRNMWNATDQLNGLVVGLVSVTGAVPPSAYGEVRVSSGVVTNSGQFAVGAGVGGTGVVWQTGGIVRQGAGQPGVTCRPMTLGWGGGSGTYFLSGGVFESQKSVYVGGISSSDLGYTPVLPSFAGNGMGVLRVDGGRFSVSNADLCVGSYGKGRLEMGSNGVCSADNIRLRDGAAATLRFEFGDKGVGSLEARDLLAIGSGARLEVDTRVYRGNVSHIRLVDCGQREGTLSSDDILVSGPGTVCQDLTEDIWLCFSEAPVTNYVAVTGSDEEGDGSPMRPWKTLAHALSKTTFPGDVVQLGAGVFAVDRNNYYGVLLACGVSLLGQGSDRTSVVLTRGDTNRIARILDLTSTSLTNGNQSVSGLTVCGSEEGSWVGIRCYNRHNVTFSDLVVSNCYRNGLLVEGSPVNAAWPDLPPDSVYCTNILVRNCVIANNGLWSADDNWAYGGLQLHQVMDSEVFGCLLDERVKGGWPVKGTWLKNVDIHNCDAWVCPPSVKQQRDFSMEVWYMIGCEVYDNRCNGSFSMGFNDGLRIHHNDVRAGPDGKQSYGVEWGGYNSTVDHNYFEGMKIGIAAWCWGTNLCVAHNVMRGCTNALLFYGVDANSFAGFHDVQVFNNTFDLSGEMYNGGPLTFRAQTNAFITGVSVKNNIIMNSCTPRAAICLTGLNGRSTFAEYVTNTVIDHNLFFNNPGEDVYNNGTLDLVVGTNMHTNPQIRAVGAMPVPYYAYSSDGPCVGAGAEIGLPYNGSAPDIGACPWPSGPLAEAELFFSDSGEGGASHVSVVACGEGGNKGVLLPDEGDAVRLHFLVTEQRRYRFSVRVLAGKGADPYGLLDGGYAFFSLHEPLTLELVASSVSAPDSMDGSVWATLRGEVVLDEGPCHVLVRAVKPGLLMDWFSVEAATPNKATRLLVY